MYKTALCCTRCCDACFERSGGRLMMASQKDGALAAVLCGPDTYGFLCYSGTGAKATAVGQTALALEQGPTGFGFGLAIPAMDRWCQRRRRVAAPIFVAASCGFAAP